MLHELRVKWGSTLDEMETIAKKAQDAGKLISDEEGDLARYQELEAEEKRLRDEIKRIEELEALKKERKEPASSAASITITRDEDEDENGQPRVFASFGDQLRAVSEIGMNPHVRHERLEKCQKLMRSATGLNEAQASDGGFLVQTDFSTELLKRAYETSILASLCRKIQISPNSNSLKINAIDETSRANGSRMGGIQGYWENEADLYVGSRPKFRQMELILKKLTGLCYATDELLADSNALAGIIADGFAEEFGFKLDDAIFRGTGAGQPLGIINSNCLVTQAAEGSQTATTINLNNVAKMRSRLWARSRANSVWLINQDCEPQLNVLSLSVGNNSYPVLLPATGISGAPYDTMFGRPVIPTEYSQTLGTVGDIMLADFSQYLLIDKGSMQSASSVHVRFLYDEMVYKFTYRVDGQPIWSSTLTPYKGSNTQSPFIVLATRS